MAILQRLDLVNVVVGTNYLVTNFREACPRNKADVATAKIETRKLITPADSLTVPIRAPRAHHGSTMTVLKRLSDYAGNVTIGPTERNDVAGRLPDCCGYFCGVEAHENYVRGQLPTKSLYSGASIASD